MAKRDSTAGEPDYLNSDPPPSLRDIIEEERTRLQTALTVLGCTKVAINNDQSVDAHQFIYGDMIELARRMIDETTNRLDSTYLREFYNVLASAQCEFPNEVEWSAGVTIRVCGHAKPFLTVNTGVQECGDIQDGISLVHHRETCPGDWVANSDGWWVMAWADFEAIYQSALTKRGVASMQSAPSTEDSGGFSAA